MLETTSLKEGDIFQRTFHHRFSCRMTVLFEDSFLQRSSVDPDPYGRVSFTCLLDDLFNGLGTAYVPRIDSKTVCAGVK